MGKKSTVAENSSYEVSVYLDPLTFVVDAPDAWKAADAAIDKTVDFFHSGETCFTMLPEIKRAIAQRRLAPSDPPRKRGDGSWGAVYPNPDYPNPMSRVTFRKEKIFKIFKLFYEINVNIGDVTFRIDASSKEEAARVALDKALGFVQKAHSHTQPEVTKAKRRFEPVPITKTSACYTRERIKSQD
jgi:hypothetical protein